MEALDSWIEEQQPEQAGFKIGDRVKMVAPNTDEDNGPTLPAKGFIAAYHDSIEAHYLVIFDEEFDEGHDGFGSATDESGNSISVNNGWYCDEQVLEKV